MQQFLGTKGFAKARADRPTISLSADRRSLTLTIRVKEGARYRIGTLDVDMLGGEWLIPKEELLDMVGLETGELFDLLKLGRDAQRIGDVFRDMGYANAGVSFRDQFHDERRVIDLSGRIGGDLATARSPARLDAVLGVVWGDPLHVGVEVTHGLTPAAADWGGGLWLGWGATKRSPQD